MKNIPELIFKSHQEAKSIWNHYPNPSMEDLCHSLLERQLQYLPPHDARLQKMLIDNCEILKSQGDLDAIIHLLHLIDTFTQGKISNRKEIDSLYNSIRLMIRPQAA